MVKGGAQLVSRALGNAPTLPTSLPMVSVPVPQSLANDLTSSDRLRRRIAADINAEVLVAPARGGAVLRLSSHAYNRQADFETVAAYLAVELLRAG
jgi:hypothetical protein